MSKIRGLLRALKFERDPVCDWLSRVRSEDTCRIPLSAAISVLTTATFSVCGTLESAASNLIYCRLVVGRHPRNKSFLWMAEFNWTRSFQLRVIVPSQSPSQSHAANVDFLLPKPVFTRNTTRYGHATARRGHSTSGSD